MIRQIRRFFHKKTRHPNHRSPSQQDIDYFRSFLSENEVLTKDIDEYNIDWTTKYQGESKLILLPNTTEKISKILAYCNKNLLPVVPQSGKTGLVGGSVPHYDEIVLSMKKLDKILEYDENSDIVTLEAGVVLENLNKYLEQYKTEAPYDLGAKGSCFVGGNIATHAGGKYLVKNGPLRGYVLGLEVVLPNGEIMDLTNKCRKDNTGVDLKQIFIGSEGGLGIITKVNLLCVKLPKYRDLIFIQTDSYSKIMKIYKIAKNVLSKNLAAIEWMDSFAYNAVMENVKTIKHHFQKENIIDKSYYVLLEINSNHCKDELLEAFYNAVTSEEGLASECILAQNDQQFQELWQTRELVGYACAKYGQVLKYDVSLDISLQDQIIKDLRTKCGKLGYSAGYGHIGDGNLHVNISCLDQKNIDQLEKIVQPYIFEWLQQVGGSISAEHGLGLMKADYIQYSKSPEAIEQMKNLKKIFDPNIILNPYKMLPGL